MKKLLTTAEVAALLSCSVATVYKMAEAGEITSIRVGGGHRYLTESIERLVGSEIFKNLTIEEKK